jgi:hypothetical protein
LDCGGLPQLCGGRRLAAAVGARGFALIFLAVLHFIAVGPILHAADPDLANLTFKRRDQAPPFILKFNAYDGDPAVNPNDVTFQINTLSIRTPSVFSKLGDDVAGGRFRLIKFAYKLSPNGQDLSELTLRDNARHVDFVLVYNQRKDLSVPFAVFEYRAASGATELHVTEGSEFKLPPETGRGFKLLELTKDSATVQTPEGEKVVLRPQ